MEEDFNEVTTKGVDTSAEVAHPELRVEIWWEDLVRYAPWFQPTDAMEARLHDAFKAVLSQLTPQELSRFFELHPVIFHYRSMAAGCVTPIFIGKNDHEPVIYLPPEIEQCTDWQLRRVVAHETAHILLGHLEEQERQPAECVQEAWALAGTWGLGK